MKLIHNWLQWFGIFICFTCTMHTPCVAQQQNASELLIEKADSAIEQGLLKEAERYTLQAIGIAQKEKDEHKEAKYLINLISIKLEQENSIYIDEWYDRALKILTSHKNDMELANLWNIKARHLMYNQKFNEARIVYGKVGDIYKPIGVDRVVAYYYNDMGFLEEAEGNFQQAVAMYLKAIQIFEQVNDQSGLANTLGNIANTYFNLNESQKALQYAHQSLEIRKKTGDKEGIAIVLGNIMRMYSKLNQGDSALHYQEAYIQYAKKSGKKKTLTDSYVNIAIMHHGAGNYTQAFQQMKAAIVIAKEINHPNLANYYRMCGLFLGKLNQETEMQLYLDTAWSYITKHHNHANYRDYYATLMHYYKEHSNYQQALENFELYQQYNDSIINDNSKKQIAQLEIQYATQKKTAQLEAAKAEKAEQQVLFYSIIGFLIILLLLALFWTSRYRYKKKIEQKNLLLSERNRIAAELHDEVGSSLSAIHLISHAAMQKTAQDKVQDHLQKIHYNTGNMMESISDIVWSMNPENEQVGLLATRMRTFATEILEAAEVHLLMHIETELEQVRLSPVKSKDLYLIFKEAINNASKYAQANQVNVYLQKNKKDILLTVIDNGIGFDTSILNKGNGLKNMQTRALKNGGIFQIFSDSLNGTTVTITMPM